VAQPMLPTMSVRRQPRVATSAHATATARIGLVAGLSGRARPCRPGGRRMRER
jgi:hypothetical protein